MKLSRCFILLLAIILPDKTLAAPKPEIQKVIEQAKKLGGRVAHRRGIFHYASFRGIQDWKGPDGKVYQVSPITKKDLEWIVKSMPDLETLQLADVHHIRDSELQILTGLKKLKHLRVRTNYRIPEEHHPQITDEALRFIARIEWLEELHFFSRTVTGKGILHLKSMPKLYSFATDGFQTSQFRDESYAYFAELPHLKELLLVHCRMDEVKIGHVINCPKLEHIRLNGSSRDDAQMLQLAKIKTLKILEPGYTYWSRKPITMTGVKAVATLPDLESVYLGLGDHIELREAMATLAKLKKLKKIRLSLCHKVSASDVQPLMQLKNLESISLQKGRDFKGTTLVSEETMKAFGRFPALKKFDITTEIVTQKGLRILFEAKPGIELVEKITRSKWKRWKRE